MLLNIYIKNFLYFSDINIDLDRGLNVFTGETGAGKSLILDAIEFVLGDKGSYKDGTYVELTFEVEDDYSEDGILILAREVKNSKSFLSKWKKSWQVYNRRTIIKTYRDTWSTSKSKSFQERLP